MPRYLGNRPRWKRRWAIEELAEVDFSTACKKNWRKSDLFERICKRSAFQQGMDRDFHNFMGTEGFFIFCEASEWLENHDVFSVYMAFMYGACLLYSTGQEDADALAKRAMAVSLFLFLDWKPGQSRGLVEDFFAALPDDRFSAGIEEGKRAMQDWLAIAPREGPSRLQTLMADEVSRRCSRLH